MAIQGFEGFKLTLPDGTAFRAKADIDSTIEQDWTFLFDGASNALAAYERLAKSDRGGDGLKQALYMGSGAGTRVFVFEFVQYEGSTETWGGHAGADMQRLRDVLDRALATVTIDSNSTATLEHGEFSGTGLYSTVEVVALSSNLTVNHAEESSVMNGTIRLADAADLAETNSAENMTG